MLQLLWAKAEAAPDNGHSMTVVWVEALSCGNDAFLLQRESKPVSADEPK